MKHLPSSGLERVTQAWLQSLYQSGLQPGSLDLYARVIRRFDAFVRRRRDRSVNVNQITPADLEAWKRDLVQRELKPATLQSWLGAVSRLFQWLEKTGRIFSNPSRHLAIPEVPREILLVPNEQTMLRLLTGCGGENALDQRDRAIMEVLYGSGLRRSELVGLTLDSIDLGLGVVRVCGKGRERVVPLTKAALLAVQHYRNSARRVLLKGKDSRGLWISSRTRGPISAEGIRHMLEHRSRDCETKVGAQVFRRAFATHLLSRGASVEDLRLLLGHADYGRLHHYLRYAPVQLLATHRNSRLAR